MSRTWAGAIRAVVVLCASVLGALTGYTFALSYGVLGLIPVVPIAFATGYGLSHLAWEATR